MYPLEFGNELCLKTPRCPDVHEKYILKSIVVDELPQSTRHGMQENLSSYKNVPLQKRV